MLSLATWGLAWEPFLFRQIQISFLLTDQNKQYQLAQGDFFGLSLQRPKKSRRNRQKLYLPSAADAEISWGITRICKRPKWVRGIFYYDDCKERGSTVAILTSSDLRSGLKWLTHSFLKPWKGFHWLGYTQRGKTNFAIIIYGWNLLRLNSVNSWIFLSGKIWRRLWGQSICSY